jgi:hypothetical protein
VDDSEIDRLATCIVQKMMEPSFRDTFAEAIAKELRLLAAEYRTDMEKLGERLDSDRF